MNSAWEQAKRKLLQESRTWLITGVAGFIGSHLLYHLLLLNQKVIGIDNFATGSQKNIDTVLNKIPQFKANFNFIKGDICSLEDCQKAMKNAEIVLHQAALGSVPRSIQKPIDTHLTNTNGFLNILLTIRENNVKRLVYASSSAVYGDAMDLPKVEEIIGKPLSPYAVSKYTNELYANAFSECFDLEAIGLRYFNVFGPYQDTNSSYAAVIPQWLKAIALDEAVYINGDGKTSRDFCYIDNVVQANILAALTTNQNALNTVYNIAVGEQNTLNKLYELMITMMDQQHHAKLIYRDFRNGDVKHSLADISKAQSALGYMPTHNLVDGLKPMITWYRSLSPL